MNTSGSIRGLHTQLCTNVLHIDVKMNNKSMESMIGNSASCTIVINIASRQGQL